MIKSPFKAQLGQGAYSASIYIDSDLCVAKDRGGHIISEGTDETSVFNAAIADVANKGGGVVYIDKGDYTLSNTINLPTYDTYLELLGLGRPKLIMDFDGSAISAYWKGSWGRIKSIEIDCNSHQGNGITLARPSRDFIIEDCRIHDFTHTIAAASRGIHITTTDNHSVVIGFPKITIKDCFIYDFHNAMGILADAAGVGVYNSTIYNGTSVGQDCGLSLAERGIAIGNTVYNCVNGIALAKTGIAKGNYAISNKYQGIVPKRDCTVIGNICMFNKQSGIDFWYTYHSTIQGNVCLNNGTDTTDLPDSNGIDVDNHSTYNLIEGNVCGNTATDWSDTLKDAASSGHSYITVNTPQQWYLYMRINIDGETRTITAIDLANYKLTIDSVLGSNHDADASVTGVNTQQLGIRLSASEADGSDYNIVTNNLLLANLGGTYVKASDVIQSHTYCDQWKYLSLPNDDFVIDGKSLWYNNGSNDFLAIHIGSGTWKKIQLA